MEDIYSKISHITGVSRNDVKRVVHASQYMGVPFKAAPSPELLAAREIAAEHSKQTGINKEKFLSGVHDHAYGVRCALAGIEYGREKEYYDGKST